MLFKIILFVQSLVLLLTIFWIHNIANDCRLDIMFFGEDFTYNVTCTTASKKEGLVLVACGLSSIIVAVIIVLNDRERVGENHDDYRKIPV